MKSIRCGLAVVPKVEQQYPRIVHFGMANQFNIHILSVVSQLGKEIKNRWAVKCLCRESHIASLLHGDLFYPGCDSHQVVQVTNISTLWPVYLSSYWL